MAAPHVAWTHTENLAATFLGDPVHMDRNLGRVVCVTEKLDGSNCGIHVRRLGDDPNAPWGLAAIAGRNQHVWAPEDGSPVPLATEGATIDERVAAQKGIPVVGYGNAASLGAVPIYAAHVAVEVAKTIPGATELILYGEAFRARTTKTVQPFASFHPFGFKVIGDRASLAAAAADEEAVEDAGVGVLATAKLTRDTHALFTRLAVRAPPVGTFGQALFDYLLTVPGHAVFPPPMVHHGPFYDGADRLHELLSTAPPTLEGFFIATDDGEPYGLYCKWKTPLFEEQANVPKLEELCASRFARATTGTTHGRPKLPPFVDALNDEKLEDGTTGMDREKAALPPNLRRVFDLACALVAASQAAKAAHKSVKLAKADAAPKAEKRKNEKLLARIDTALHREATKDPALAPGGMPEAKPARKAIAERVLASVLTELQQQMAADGEEWTDAIAKEAKVETTKLVMAPIMNGDVSAWRD